MTTPDLPILFHLLLAFSLPRTEGRVEDFFSPPFARSEESRREDSLLLGEQTNTAAGPTKATIGFGLLAGGINSKPADCRDQTEGGGDAGSDLQR